MKTDRLLSIALILIYRRTATIGELSRQFGVSERTVYRDVSLLESAGFPIISSPGRGGGIGLVHGFGIENKLFSSNSFSILASTLHSLGTLLDDDSMESDAKLAAGVGHSPADELIRIELSSPNYHALAPLMKTLVQAISDRRKVEILYPQSSGSAECRTLEPLRLLLWERDWYLQAWCPLRTDYRMFSLRKILEVRVLEELFDRPSRMADLPAPQFPQAPPGEPVKVRIAAHRSDLVARFSDGKKFVQSDGTTEVEIAWPVNEWLISYFCGLAPEVQVVSPPDLRQKVLDRLKTAVETYQRFQEP